jgi:hypothetical protein
MLFAIHFSLLPFCALCEKLCVLCVNPFDNYFISRKGRNDETAKNAK